MRIFKDLDLVEQLAQVFQEFWKLTRRSRSDFRIFEGGASPAERIEYPKSPPSHPPSPQVENY